MSNTAGALQLWIVTGCVAYESSRTFGERYLRETSFRAKRETVD